jgi:hypothetical protein
MKPLFLCKNKAKIFFSLAILVALAFIAVLTSCHKEDIQDGSIFDAITEYRAFYEEQMLKGATIGHPNIPRRSPQ